MCILFERNFNKTLTNIFYENEKNVKEDTLNNIFIKKESIAKKIYKNKISVIYIYFFQHPVCFYVYEYVHIRCVTLECFAPTLNHKSFSRYGSSKNRKVAYRIERIRSNALAFRIRFRRLYWSRSTQRDDLTHIPPWLVRSSEIQMADCFFFRIVDLFPNDSLASMTRLSQLSARLE